MGADNGKRMNDLFLMSVVNEKYFTVAHNVTVLGIELCVLLCPECSLNRVTDRVQKMCCPST